MIDELGIIESIGGLLCVYPNTSTIELLENLVLKTIRTYSQWLGGGEFKNDSLTLYRKYLGA